MIEVKYAESYWARQRFYAFGQALCRSGAGSMTTQMLPERKALDPRRNELLWSPHALMMATEKGRILARVLTGVVAGKGYFALFDAQPCEEAAERLMGAVVEWQRRNGAASLVGPIAPTPVDLGGGVLVEGFEEPAAFADRYNAPHYGAYLEQIGFEMDSEWLTYRMETARFDKGKYAKIAEWTKRRFGLSVRCDLTRQPRALADAMRRVMGHEIDREAMNRLLGEMEKLLARGLCPVVFSGGKPVGFLLTLQKRRDARPRIVTMWVSEEWRRMGVTAVLFDEFVRQADRLGISEADASQIRSDNAPSGKSIEAAGGRVIHRYKQYRIAV